MRPCADRATLPIGPFVDELVGAGGPLKKKCRSAKPLMYYVLSGAPSWLALAGALQI
jgi:hypothetical protein